MPRNSKEIAGPGIFGILSVHRTEPLAGRLLKPWEDVIMAKNLVVGLFVLSLCSIAGCNSFYGRVIAASISKETGKLHFSTYERFHVCPRCIKEKSLVGSLEIADVNVVYQRGLEAQANCVAEHFNGLLDEVERKTGFRISCGTKFYLFRVDQIPQNIDVQLKADVNDLGFPLFVKAEDGSCRTIFAQNAAYPCVIVHELTEFSLILPKESGNVLPDAQGRLFLLPINVCKYTRWFREGFADYAGYTAWQTALRDKNLPSPSTFSSQGYTIPSLHEYPFSSLSNVGKKLFSWHQYSSPKLDRDYYNAAFGLFLLIERRFSQDAVSQIMLGVSKQKYLDGADLIKVVNKTLNTNIVQLADDFHFPRTGLKLTPLTPASIKNEGVGVEQGLLVTGVDPNSPADTAGIKNKDVILQVAGKKVGNNLDFELALFEVMDQEAAELALWRKDKGEFIVTLPLTRGQ